MPKPPTPAVGASRTRSAGHRSSSAPGTMRSSRSSGDCCEARTSSRAGSRRSDPPNPHPIRIGCRIARRHRVRPPSTAELKPHRPDEPASGAVSHAALESAVHSARRHLLSLQTDGGWWRAELETNVTMDAEDLLLREFLGVRDQPAIDRAANWIRSQQRGDGTWANFHGGPPNLSTTIEAYAALRLAGDPPDAPHMLAAREYILAAGGIATARAIAAGAAARAARRPAAPL